MSYDKASHPDEVFHYTNAAGFSGIVRSQTLHASNISFLNDRQELRYADAFIKGRLFSRFLAVLKDAQNQGAMQATFDPIQLAESSASSLIEVLHGVARKLAPIFVVSFCRAESVSRNGLLSQWRGYGSEGAVAICFDVKGLNEVLETERRSFQYLPGGLCDVIYGADDPEFKTIAEDFEIFAGAVPDLIEGELGRLGIRYRYEGARGSINDTQLPYMRIAPRLKHPGFREEFEYRAILPVARAEVEPASQAPRKTIKFRAGREYLIPYIEVNELNKRRLPIKAVIVGPFREAERRGESVKLFLRENGYDDVDVQLSDIPFV